MSLINDALKRAKQTQPTPGQPATTSEPMRPAETHQSVGLPRYFFPLLLCIICGALWIIVRGWNPGRPGPDQAALTVQARASLVPAEVPVEPEYHSSSIPENRNFSLDGEGGRGEAGVIASTAVTPAFRLQGIFYRAANPSAVVNAKTVYVGDQVSGARVKAIDRQSVILEQDGQTQVLTLR